MRQLLLLDLDGTVVDSMGLIIRCFREAVLPCTTKAPSNEEIAATFGPAEEECIERLLLQHQSQGLLREPYTPAMKQQAATRFHELYANGYEHGLVECYPGVSELVHRVRTAGWATAIFTGKGKGSAIATLKHVNLLASFDAVVTSDDVVHPKPASDGVLRACELTGVAPAQTIYVGDNPTDIIAGKRAGTRTAAAMWGAVYPEETLATQPDYVLHSVGELESLLFR